MILKQQEAIQEDIADNTELVSDILPLQSLETEFQTDEVFKSKILKLGQKYSRMTHEARQTRRKLLLPSSATDTINVMTEPEKKEKEAKAKIQTEIRMIRPDDRILLDLYGNTPKKFLNAKVKDMNKNLKPGVVIDGKGGVKRKSVASNLAPSKLRILD